MYYCELVNLKEFSLAIKGTARENAKWKRDRLEVEAEKMKQKRLSERVGNQAHATQTAADETAVDLLDLAKQRAVDSFKLVSQTLSLMSLVYSKIASTFR
jgi:hypothetical protein